MGFLQCRCRKEARLIKQTPELTNLLALSSLLFDAFSVNVSCSSHSTNQPSLLLTPKQESVGLSVQDFSCVLYVIEKLGKLGFRLDPLGENSKFPAQFK